MNPYLLHGEELARTEKARRDHSTSVSSGSASALNPKAAWPFPQTREELLAERDQLREQNKELVEALNLLLHGYMAHAFLGAQRYDSSADNDPIIIKARAVLAKIT